MTLFKLFIVHPNYEPVYKIKQKFGKIALLIISMVENVIYERKFVMELIRKFVVILRSTKINKPPHYHNILR